MRIINNHDTWCLFRYYVGVLNKQTMQMEVHSAQLFNMQPVIPGKKKNQHYPLVIRSLHIYSYR